MNLKIYYQGLWDSFDYNDNIFTWILKHNYNVIIDKDNPDLIISGGYKKRPNVLTLYFSFEPFFLSNEEFNYTCDYGMSGYHINKKNYFRFPAYLYFIYGFMKNGIIKDFSFFYNNRQPSKKTNFCNLISRSFIGKREEFFLKLNKYKRIDVNVGPYKNIDVPGSGFGGSLQGSHDKVNFIKDYKFTFSIENSSIKNGLDGYITEKPVEPMVANSLPIYWGNTRISEDFNTNTFLNFHDFKNDDELIERIIELDNNEDLYNKYFCEPFITDKQNSPINKDYLINIFEEILKK